MEDVSLIRSWLQCFDVEGNGVAKKKDLEPELKEVLGFSTREIERLLDSCLVGIDGIDYDALMTLVFEEPVKKDVKRGSLRLEQLDPKGANIRSAELAWLRKLSVGLPEHLRKIMVCHRGFHCIDGRLKRPLANTLPAFEYAWQSGILHCACDVRLTEDGNLVLNHTSTPTEWLACQATLSSDEHFVRQPLLRELLNSAVSIGSAQLAIEVKPVGRNISGILVDFLETHPQYLKHVAALMSFDPDVVFQIAEKWPVALPRPKIMLLTAKKHLLPAEPYEQVLDFDQGDVREDVQQMIVRDGVRLDGVYVEWTEKLLGRSASWLQKLCEQCTVGLWQKRGRTDCLGLGTELARLGVSFVNTDFPRGFLREYVGKAQPEERRRDSLFASIVPAPGGNADGVWKERPKREELIKALEERQFDILIIGGGATGLGTALEAIRQGYSVALVERGDFACGTSSKSSNMIHGGIRYLQAFVNNPDAAKEQIDVVKKGLAEQIYMYNCAPYNVKPCPFMVACYSEDERETFGKLLKKYDELGSDDPFPESNWNTKKETLFRFPHLRQEGLIGSYIYYDGQQDDARMATIIALTAIEAGAVISNYVAVQSLIKEEGITKGAVVTDMDSGDGRLFEVRARVVVNATGPFTDAIIKMDQGPGLPNIIKPAAGTHVVLPDHFSPDRTGLAILETSDGRTLFYLPWMGQTIVGTTDHLSEIKPLLSPPESDIEWILKEVNRYLNPDHTPASRKDVLAAWIGIRPLAQGLQSATGTKDVEVQKEGGGADTKSVPREHAVIISDSNLVTITGGKWTSYRHMAEDTLREAVQVGGLQPLKRQMQAGGPTFEQGFVGTKAGPNVDYVQLDLACAAPFHSDVVELRKKWRFSREIAENLVTSYGTHAIEVACIARRGEKQGLAQRLAEGYPWIMAQVVYGVRREYARTVADVLSRRTRLAQVDVLAAYDAVPSIVEVMAEELNWSQDRIQAEIRDTSDFLESCGLAFCSRHHGM